MSNVIDFPVPKRLSDGVTLLRWPVRVGATAFKASEYPGWLWMRSRSANCEWVAFWVPRFVVVVAWW